MGFNAQYLKNAENYVLPLARTTRVTNTYSSSLRAKILLVKLKALQPECFYSYRLQWEDYYYNTLNLLTCRTSKNGTR